MDTAGRATCTRTCALTDGSRADLGITSTSPKSPEFAIEARRLSTFATWPTTHHLQPDMLAKAGFFYLGKEAAARCFFCYGTVADWKTNSDPWVEHAQLFPSCSFVLQEKGHDFVQQHRLQDPQPASSSRPSLAVDPREVRARMDANKVRILLQMDYPLDLIREVVQKRLATVGSDHDTSEQLLNDVFQTHDEKQKANSTQNAGARPADSGLSCNRQENPEFAIAALRLSTFATWPANHRLLPMDIARAGFFYNGKDDHVQCAFCDGIVVYWPPDCNPLVEHMRLFPSCPFFKREKTQELLLQCS